jgi:hypothetical protein
MLSRFIDQLKPAGGSKSSVYAQGRAFYGDFAMPLNIVNGHIDMVAGYVPDDC